jgi:hypothetical protein
MPAAAIAAGSQFCSSRDYLICLAALSKKRNSCRGNHRSKFGDRRISMSKMADFEKMLDSIGNPIDLKKFYQDQGLGEKIDYKHNAIDGQQYSLMDELSSCSGAAILATKYFTGNLKLVDSAGRGMQPEQLFAGQEAGFASKFSEKLNRVAYVTADGDHDFILIKEGGTYALYQANVTSVPHYTLCKALNKGVEYNIRGMDNAGFVALLRKLTNANESNKIFFNKNTIKNYNAAFAEF